MNTEDKELFEFDESKHMLNLDFYLHRAIIKWQDALEASIKQDGKGLETGLTVRSLEANMVEGIAKAKNTVHWDKEELPDKKDKNYDRAVKNNKEAEAFQKRYEAYKKQIEKNAEMPKNVKNVKLADFKVFEILNVISKGTSKTGKVIV